MSDQEGGPAFGGIIDRLLDVIFSGTVDRPGVPDQSQYPDPG